MIELTQPIETLDIWHVNRHRAQIAILLDEPDAPVTELVELLCQLHDRAKAIDHDEWQRSCP